MVTQFQERTRMPSDTLYIRLPPPLQQRLAEFLDAHPEFPTQAAAGAALVRLGLDYSRLQQRLSEEMAASEQLRQERARAQSYMQHVNRLVTKVVDQHRMNPEPVDLATFNMLADEVRLAAAIVGRLDPADDAGI